jgi:hypothetical protein
MRAWFAAVVLVGGLHRCFGTSHCHPSQGSSQCDASALQSGAKSKGTCTDKECYGDCAQVPKAGWICPDSQGMCGPNDLGTSGGNDNTKAGVMTWKPCTAVTNADVSCAGAANSAFVIVQTLAGASASASVDDAEILRQVTASGASDAIVTATTDNLDAFRTGSISAAEMLTAILAACRTGGCGNFPAIGPLITAKKEALTRLNDLQKEVSFEEIDTTQLLAEISQLEDFVTTDCVELTTRDADAQNDASSFQVCVDDCLKTQTDVFNSCEVPREGSRKQFTYGQPNENGFRSELECSRCLRTCYDDSVSSANGLHVSIAAVVLVGMATLL